MRTLPCEIPPPVHSYRKQLDAANINQRHLPRYPPHANNTRQGGEIKLLIPTNPVSLGGASLGRGTIFWTRMQTCFPQPTFFRPPLPHPRHGSVRNVKTAAGGERYPSPHPEDYPRRTVRNTHRGRQTPLQGEGRGRRRSRNEGGGYRGRCCVPEDVAMGWNFGRVTRVYVCHVVYGSSVTKEGTNSTSLGKN